MKSIAILLFLVFTAHVFAQQENLGGDKDEISGRKKFEKDVIGFLEFKTGMIRADVSHNFTSGELINETETVPYDLSTYREISSFSSFQVLLNLRFEDDTSMGITGELLYANSDLIIWSSDLRFGYHFPFLENRLSIIPSGGLGIGYASQQLPKDVISSLSSNYSETVYAFSLKANAEIKAKLNFANFGIITELSFRHLQFDNWKYKKNNNTGFVFSNDDEETETAVHISSDLVPYKKIHFNSPAIFVGISFNL